MSEIVELIDKGFRAFCTANPSYSIYRIGSSLYYPLSITSDIDYLVINQACPTDFSREIVQLKETFSDASNLVRTIRISDEHFEACVRQLSKSVKASHEKNIEYSFSFGPMNSQKNIKPSPIYLHIAGPMNLRSMNYFFSVFPMFYSVLSQHNISLGEPSFNKMINSQKVHRSHLNDSIRGLLDRIVNSNNSNARRSVLKRIELLRYCYNRIPKAYELAFEKVNSLSDEEVNIELKKNYS